MTVAHRAYGHSKEGDELQSDGSESTSATLGDGGIYSNVQDLAKWDDALTTTRCLSESGNGPALTPAKKADGSPLLLAER